MKRENASGMMTAGGGGSIRKQHRNMRPNLTAQEQLQQRLDALENVIDSKSSSLREIYRERADMEEEVLDLLQRLKIEKKQKSILEMRVKQLEESNHKAISLLQKVAVNFLEIADHEKEFHEALTKKKGKRISYDLDNIDDADVDYNVGDEDDYNDDDYGNYNSGKHNLPSPPTESRSSFSPPYHQGNRTHRSTHKHHGHVSHKKHGAHLNSGGLHAGHNENNVRNHHHIGSGRHHNTHPVARHIPHANHINSYDHDDHLPRNSVHHPDAKHLHLHLAHRHGVSHRQHQSPRGHDNQISHTVGHHTNNKHQRTQNGAKHHHNTMSHKVPISRHHHEIGNSTARGGKEDKEENHESHDTERSEVRHGKLPVKHIDPNVLREGVNIIKNHGEDNYDTLMHLDAVKSKVDSSLEEVNVKLRELRIQNAANAAKVTENVNMGANIDTSLEEVKIRIQALKAVNPSEVFNPPTSVGIVKNVVSTHQSTIKKNIEKNLESDVQKGNLDANDADNDSGSCANTEIVDI